MEFTIKKVNNCFKDSETFEYAIGVKARELTDTFESMGELKINTALRRPVFTLDLPDGTNIKGILAESVLRASFRDEGAKVSFELWLGALTC